ncbi:MAG: hypothetical protein ACYC4L_15625 [Chloroflexota bacterium]
MLRPGGPQVVAVVYACLVGATWSASLLPALALLAGSSTTGPPLLALLAVAPLIVGALGPGCATGGRVLDHSRFSLIPALALALGPALYLLPGPDWQLIFARSILGLALISRANLLLLGGDISLGWGATVVGAGLGPAAVGLVVARWGEPSAHFVAIICGLAAFAWRALAGRGDWLNVLAATAPWVSAPAALARAATFAVLLWLPAAAADVGHGWLVLGTLCGGWAVGLAPSYLVTRRFGARWAGLSTVAGFLLGALAAAVLAQQRELPLLIAGSLGLGAGLGAVEAAGTFGGERLRVSLRLGLAWQAFVVMVSGVCGLFYGLSAAMLLAALLLASGAVACTMLSPRHFQRRRRLAPSATEGLELP